MSISQTIIDAYKTEFDAFHENSRYAEKQYAQGLELAQRGAIISITINGVWSADIPGGGCVTSYETLGYHACTKHLLQGWIDGGATIIDYRSKYNMLTCQCGRSGPMQEFVTCDGECVCGRTPLPWICTEEEPEEDTMTHVLDRTLA